jgi:hypothetical protein
MFAAWTGSARDCSSRWTSRIPPGFVAGVGAWSALLT